MAHSFTIAINSVCSGGDHVKTTVTVDGSRTFTRVFSKSELQNLDVTPEEAAFLRLKSYWLENNLNALTAAQQKTSIEAQTFKV